MDKLQEPAGKITYQGYSWGTKTGIIDEIESGRLSINQASIRYGISRSTIQEWIKKYGNFERKLREMGGRSPKQEIQELKKKLQRLETEKEILETAIEIIEDEYGVDVRKKYLPESLKRTLRELKKR